MSIRSFLRSLFDSSPKQGSASSDEKSFNVVGEPGCGGSAYAGAAGGGGSIVTVQTIGAFKDAKMIGAGGSKECRVIHIEDEQYTGGRGGTCHAVAAGGGGTDNSVVTLKHSGETSGEIWGVGAAHARDVPPIGGGYAAPPVTVPEEWKQVQIEVSNKPKSR